MVFDGKFINRVYRTSACVLLVGIVWCLGLGQPLAALGLTVGAAMGAAGLRSLELLVKRTVTPSEQQAGGFPLAKYSLLKYPAYLLIIAPVVISRSIPLIIGFVAGLGLVQMVIVLKAVGQMLLQPKERQKEV